MAARWGPRSRKNFASGRYTTSGVSRSGRRFFGRRRTRRLRVSVSPMDAAAALERLREISSQVRAAVIFERGGKVVGATFADDQRAKDVAEEAEALLTEAEQRRDADGEAAEFSQLEVALLRGGVVVVRDGGRLLARRRKQAIAVGL